jgi:transposase-like protein
VRSSLSDHSARQAKAGQTSAASQRYRCKGCGHKYTPQLRGSPFRRGRRRSASIATGQSVGPCTPARPA